jgi:hypothetical protein
VIETYDTEAMSTYLQARRNLKRDAEEMVARLQRYPDYRPIRGGARQYLQDGPYIDPPVSAPLSGNTATTAVDMWTGATYTPIFANDPKAGKVYTVEAGGLMTWATTGTLTISPFYGTSSGVALGASAAYTGPGTAATNVPWYLRFIIVFRVIGAAGANSTVTCTGVLTTGVDGTTVKTGVTIPFGSTSTTSTSVDATVNKDITIQKTLSVAGSWSTNWAYIFSLN